ncbi:hypothetical protein [Sunxiuqinia rutila]|uniref:hypothetical protein n=1 Tax=Sunxiuqinia rutila TaxID=1397841 RepID=UPI003D35D509
MTNNKIDINQRIPLETLQSVLESYLNDYYSDEYILEQLRLHFSGENRLKKSVRIVKKIISNNPIIDIIDANREQTLSAIKSKSDRNVILMALLNGSFVFSYDLLSILGKLFKVQEFVNREALTKEISKIYGSNRSLPNAIDSVIPMYIEAGFFSRPAPGLYEFKEAINLTNEISQKIYIESFKVHNANNEIQAYQLNDPYFEFLAL